jgi:hypothetical protein
MYEKIVEYLSSLPQWAVQVPSGELYYCTERGELMIVTEDSDTLVDPSDESGLTAIHELIHHPDTVILNPEPVTEATKTFEVIDDFPVLSGGTDAQVEIGKIIHGIDKASGMSLVLIVGFKGAGMTIATPLADAEGKVNRNFVADLQGYAFAMMEVADTLSRKYLNEPVIPDFNDVETTDNSIFPAQRRAEA